MHRHHIVVAPQVYLAFPTRSMNADRAGAEDADFILGALASVGWRQHQIATGDAPIALFHLGAGTRQVAAPFPTRPRIRAAPAAFCLHGPMCPAGATRAATDGDRHAHSRARTPGRPAPPMRRSGRPCVPPGGRRTNHGNTSRSMPITVASSVSSTQRSTSPSARSTTTALDRHRHHRPLRTLVGILVATLADRQVRYPAELVPQALQAPSLFLQRRASGEVEVETEDADVHVSGPRTPRQ